MPKSSIHTGSLADSKEIKMEHLKIHEAKEDIKEIVNNKFVLFSKQLYKEKVTKDNDCISRELMSVYGQLYHNLKQTINNVKKLFIDALDI